VTVAILLRRALARPGQSDEHEVLGPCERGALVAGLRLAAALGTDAVAIAAGPARREDRVLAMALRAGASRSVRLGAEGIDDLDYLGLAEALAATVRSINADLIACGDRSIDERTGAIGPAIAELLGYAHVTGVVSCTVDGPRILCERFGDGRRDKLAVKRPAVLCVRPPRASDTERESNDTPNPFSSSTGPGTRNRARTSPQAIDALDADEVGLDLRRLAPRKNTGGRLRPVRGGKQATILATPAELVARLQAEALLK
jgi:electron transfer flavoprotein alpha/beta subunit